MHKLSIGFILPYKDQVVQSKRPLVFTEVAEKSVS